MSAPAPPRPAAWTAQEAERYLLGLELFGMRFGLERMRRLLAELGEPQRAFTAVHVVGTNGKSSTARMLAAILEAHGVRTATYTSPHLVSFTERMRVGEADLAPAAFAAAVQRTAAAAARVEAQAPADEHVTQFEAVTAAAFTAFAAAGVDTAVVEAGLGGRWDATNVLDDSPVQVLTSVALDHTEWLGDTVAAIAAEKLDVVRPGATLVTGEGLDPQARAVAERVCAERGATLRTAPAEAGVALAARGAYQPANFALARTAAQAVLAARAEPVALDEQAVARAAATVLVPGRFDPVGTAPDTYLDGAHNPAGAAALARAIAAVRAGRRTVLVLSVLDGKDAAGILGQLLPVCDVLVCTTNANPRALDGAALAAAAREAGFAQVLVEPEPRAALALGRRTAGPGGLAVASGSIYLIADLLRPAGAGPGATL